MARDNLNDLLAFVAVAQERSFTRAAVRLGLSQSALSQTIRGLEARLGLRLLMRTTRSVAPTEAGERLLRSVGPRFAELEAGLAAVNDLRGKPAGTVRITADEHAVDAVLWPALQKLLPAYPNICVELGTDLGLTDILAGRFDAGVRLGEVVAKDMVVVPIGPDTRMAAVGSPAYFARRPPPRTPHDLTDHACINLRLPNYGGLYVWEFKEAGRELRVRVDGQVVFNTVGMVLRAAVDGFGIAYLPQSQVQPHLDADALAWVLGDWSPPLTGYHLYYPSGRRNAPAFELVLEALRYTGAARQSG